MEKADTDIINRIINKVDSVLNQNINITTRIRFPLVWARLPNGIRIQDLHEERYNECLDVIKRSYMYDEVLCKSIELLDDEESTQNYLNLIKSRMYDTQSLIAVKEDENRIVGCLIERVVESLVHRTMSRMGIYEGTKLCKIQRFRKHILKSVKFYELFGTHRCNDIYLWCVLEEFRGMGIGSALLRAATRQTELFKSALLCGIFTSEQSQAMAKAVGFETTFETQYATWVEGEEVVFVDPGPSNYAAAFMVIYFEPKETFQEQVEEEEDEFEEYEGEEDDEEGTSVNPDDIQKVENKK